MLHSSADASRLAALRTAAGTRHLSRRDEPGASTLSMLA